MDLNYSKEESAFRDEVRGWLKANLPQDLRDKMANHGDLTYQEDGARHSIYFLRPRSRDDLQRRMMGHKRIADFTHGMFGRSPDHVASFVTGMVMKLDELKAPAGRPENVLAYYKHIRDKDLYTVYAVLPPQAATSMSATAASPTNRRRE